MGGALCFFGNHVGKINMARDMGDPTKGRFAMKGGWLTKRGHKVKNWKRRWFSLRGNSIHYYKNPRVRHSSLSLAFAFPFPFSPTPSILTEIPWMTNVI